MRITDCLNIPTRSAMGTVRFTRSPSAGDLTDILCVLGDRNLLQVQHTLVAINPRYIPDNSALSYVQASQNHMEYLREIFRILSDSCRRWGSVLLCEIHKHHESRMPLRSIALVIYNTLTSHS